MYSIFYSQWMLFFIFKILRTKSWEIVNDLQLIKTYFPYIFVHFQIIFLLFYSYIFFEIRFSASGTLD